MKEILPKEPFSSIFLFSRAISGSKYNFHGTEIKIHISVYVCLNWFSWQIWYENYFFVFIRSERNVINSWRNKSSFPNLRKWIEEIELSQINQFIVNEWNKEKLLKIYSETISNNLHIDTVFNNLEIIVEGASKLKSRRSFSFTKSRKYIFFIKKSTSSTPAPYFIPFFCFSWLKKKKKSQAIRHPSQWKMTKETSFRRGWWTDRDKEPSPFPSPSFLFTQIQRTCHRATYSTG